MSHPASSELPEHLIDLGHQLLAYHRSHTVRRSGFRPLIQIFEDRYPTADRAPTYPPEWLSDTEAFKAAAAHFASEAGPTLTNPAHQRTRSLQLGLQRSRPDQRRPLFETNASESVPGSSRSPPSPRRDISTSVEGE